jgi:hypothetical protein
MSSRAHDEPVIFGRAHVSFPPVVSGHYSCLTLLIPNLAPETSSCFSADEDNHSRRFATETPPLSNNASKHQ